jgi:hypothetical protein
MSPPAGTVLPDGTVGQVYSQTFTVVSGGQAPYDFIPSGTPTGMSFKTNNTYSATLYGTPTQSGTGNFDVEVIDDTGAVTDLSYQLTINSTSTGSITISPTTIASGTANTAYSQTLTVTGGTGSYTWSLSGQLPSGISFTASNADATLSGTPAASGSSSFTVTVTDSSSDSGSQSYTLTVN